MAAAEDDLTNEELLQFHFALFSAAAALRVDFLVEDLAQVMSNVGQRTLQFGSPEDLRLRLMKIRQDAQSNELIELSVLNELPAYVRGLIMSRTVDTSLRSSGVKLCIANDGCRAAATLAAGASSVHRWVQTYTDKLAENRATMPTFDASSGIVALATPSLPYPSRAALLGSIYLFHEIRTKTLTGAHLEGWTEELQKAAGTTTLPPLGSTAKRDDGLLGSAWFNIFVKFGTPSADGAPLPAPMPGKLLNAPYRPYTDIAGAVQDVLAALQPLHQHLDQAGPIFATELASTLSSMLSDGSVDALIEAYLKQWMRSTCPPDTPVDDINPAAPRRLKADGGVQKEIELTKAKLHAALRHGLQSIVPHIGHTIGSNAHATQRMQGVWRAKFEGEGDQAVGFTPVYEAISALTSDGLSRESSVSPSKLRVPPRNPLDMLILGNLGSATQTTITRTQRHLTGATVSSSHVKGKGNKSTARSDGWYARYTGPNGTDLTMPAGAEVMQSDSRAPFCSAFTAEELQSMRDSDKYALLRALWSSQDALNHVLQDEGTEGGQDTGSVQGLQERPYASAMELIIAGPCDLARQLLLSIAGAALMGTFKPDPSSSAGAGGVGNSEHEFLFLDGWADRVSCAIEWIVSKVSASVAAQWLLKFTRLVAEVQSPSIGLSSTAGKGVAGAGGDGLHATNGKASPSSAAGLSLTAMRPKWIEFAERVWPSVPQHMAAGPAQQHMTLYARCFEKVAKRHVKTVAALSLNSKHRGAALKLELYRLRQEMATEAFVAYTSAVRRMELPVPQNAQSPSAIVTTLTRRQLYQRLTPSGSDAGVPGAQAPPLAVKALDLWRQYEMRRAVTFGTAVPPASLSSTVPLGSLGSMASTTAQPAGGVAGMTAASKGAGVGTAAGAQKPSSALAATIEADRARWIHPTNPGCGDWCEEHRIPRDFFEIYQLFRMSWSEERDLELALKYGTTKDEVEMRYDSYLAASVERQKKLHGVIDLCDHAYHVRGPLRHDSARDDTLGVPLRPGKKASSSAAAAPVSVPVPLQHLEEDADVEYVPAARDVVMERHMAEEAAYQASAPAILAKQLQSTLSGQGGGSSAGAGAGGGSSSGGGTGAGGGSGSAGTGGGGGQQGNGGWGGSGSGSAGGFGGGSSGAPGGGPPGGPGRNLTTLLDGRVGTNLSKRGKPSVPLFTQAQENSFVQLFNKYNGNPNVTFVWKAMENDPVLGAFAVDATGQPVPGRLPVHTTNTMYKDKHKHLYKHGKVNARYTSLVTIEGAGAGAGAGAEGEAYDEGQEYYGEGEGAEGEQGQGEGVAEGEEEQGMLALHAQASYAQGASAMVATASKSSSGGGGGGRSRGGWSAAEVAAFTKAYYACLYDNNGREWGNWSRMVEYRKKHLASTGESLYPEQENPTAYKDKARGLGLGKPEPGQGGGGRAGAQSAGGSVSAKRSGQKRGREDVAPASEVPVSEDEAEEGEMRLDDISGISGLGGTLGGHGRGGAGEAWGTSSASAPPAGAKGVKRR